MIGFTHDRIALTHDRTVYTHGMIGLTHESVKPDMLVQSLAVGLLQVEIDQGGPLLNDIKA